MDLTEQTTVARDLRVYIENPRAITPQQKYELFQKLYEMGLSYDRHWNLDTGGMIKIFKETDTVYIVYATSERGTMFIVSREDKDNLALIENGKRIVLRDMRRLTVCDIFYQVMQLREDWRSGKDMGEKAKLKASLDFECTQNLNISIEDGQDKIIRIEKDVYYFKKGDYPFFFFRANAENRFLFYHLSNNQ